VPIEHLRHLCSVTAGRCEMVVGTMHNTPFTDMNDSEGAVQEAGYAAFESGGRALRLMAALLPACAIDGARVRANADAACITITELADTLVRDAGLSFRQAHEIAARTARAAIAARQPLSEAYPAFADAFATETGHAAGLDAAAFAAAVAPETFVARRDRPGGPAPAALDAAFATYRETLAAQLAAAARRDARMRDGADKLDAAFNAFLED
jgi:argininosuccinate lyase